MSSSFDLDALVENARNAVAEQVKTSTAKHGYHQQFISVAGLETVEFQAAYDRLIADILRRGVRYKVESAPTGYITISASLPSANQPSILGFIVDPSKLPKALKRFVR